MRPFKYTSADNVNTAVQTAGLNAQAKFLAGGTNLLDLMKEYIEQPDELVDINRLELYDIQSTLHGVAIGALGKNADTANHPLIREKFPLLSQAILAGASAQIRNMASNGGNLNQRTRCSYFYDVAMPCNKRNPGSGCSALEGENRMHAIFGWSKDCIAVHPSDMCVALAALDATVKVQDKQGQQRTIPFADYHRLPGNNPSLDNNLQAGELVTMIEIPANPFAGNSNYLKIRDRSSYAFALVSVASALEIKSGKVQQARIAMGGVAHKPWRAMAAEKWLQGKAASKASFIVAAGIAMKEAKPLTHNLFKVELGKRAIIRSLQLSLTGSKI